MKFGSVPLSDAEGGLLAHAQKLPSGKISKGTVLSAGMLADMAAAGLSEVIVARMEPGDVDENIAAAGVADTLRAADQQAALRLTAPFTGRVNIVAEASGIVEIDVEAIAALNSVNPMITLATVPQYARVTPGMLVGTVKIIAYGVAEADMLAAARAGTGALRLRPAVHGSAGLVLTELGPEDARLRDKSIAAIETRLTQLGMTLSETRSVPHRADEIGAAMAGISGDMALLLTASATSDPADVGPEGVRAAGGTVTRFGMPVDPGNLLFLGEIGARPVIGLPGCARSPALNGADWVLERVACGVPVSGADIAAMGVGGLLKEIPSRPQPRRARRPKA